MHESQRHQVSRRPRLLEAHRAALGASPAAVGGRCAGRAGQGWRASLRGARCSEYSTVCMPISSVCTMPCMPTRKTAVCVFDRMSAIDPDCSSTSDARAMPDWCMSRSTYSHPTPSSTCAVRTEGSAHARGRQRGAGRRRGERRASAAHVERGERGQHGNGSRHKNCGYGESLALGGESEFAPFDAREEREQDRQPCTWVR